jgi:cell division protein FtsW
MNRITTKVDPILFLLALVATILGLFVIYDAGFARSIQFDQGIIPREFKAQLVSTVLALGVGALITMVPLKFWQRNRTWVFVLTLLALLATHAPGMGVTQSGATRWIGIGPLQLQPSEFAKVGVILFLAGAFAVRKDWVQPRVPSGRWDVWLDRIAVPKLIRALPLLAVLVIVLKIELEPDLGTAAVVMMIAFVMMWVGGVTKKSMLIVACTGLIFAGMLAVKQPYRFERITGHMHRWESKNIDDVGYQTTQSEIHQASTGWKILGVGSGRAKHMLPGATTDFVLATVGEELGLFGVLGVMAIILLIVLRLLYLCQFATSKMGALILAGVAGWLSVQSCVNVMMANGALPPIGIPLPFFSSGGSSLIALWLAMGIAQAAVAADAEKEGVREHSDHGWRDRRSRLSRA